MAAPPAPFPAEAAPPVEPPQAPPPAPAGPILEDPPAGGKETRRDRQAREARNMESIRLWERDHPTVV
jgi:hypothetical protein